MAETYCDCTLQDISDGLSVTFTIIYMNTIAVVIPCFKVREHILNLVANIGPIVSRIYIVDDACPENSGEYVRSNSFDPRVSVITLDKNKGVGGAVMAGYEAAIQDNATVIVKLDGDGQMDPSLISEFIEPILLGEADYTKGNRFYNLEKIGDMPVVRLIGNSGLSFITKISSGYWDIFDPVNGYTAIHRDVLTKLPLDKISNRYFFESDMLFRLNLMKAVVIDIPMGSNYGKEKSNLKVSKVFFEFTLKHIKNFFTRVLFSYYLRDMSVASIELPLGILLILFGSVYGGVNWIHHANLGVQTPVGTAVISAISIMLGIQFILAFLAFDIASVPRRVRHKK